MIARARVERGLSRGELADAANLFAFPDRPITEYDVTWLEDLWRGGMNPPVERLKPVSEALGIYPLVKKALGY